MAVGTYRTSAVFNPFTFEQMIKPYQIYTEAYNAAEKDLNDQLDKYATIEQMADDSIRDRIEQYKTFVNNTAEKAASGDYDYKTLTEDAKRARDYYRDYAPKIAAAYERRMSDEKMWREMKLKNPNFIMTPIGSMRDYMDDPDFSISGLDVDAMNARMVKSGEMISTDIVNSTRLTPSGRAGLLKQISEMGINPAVQADYYGVATRALNGTATEEDLRKLENPVYSSLFNSLTSMINESKLDRFDNNTARIVIDGYLRNQIEGIKYNETSSFINDPAYMKASSGFGSDDDFPKPIGWKQGYTIHSTRTPKQLGKYLGNSFVVNSNGVVEAKSMEDVFAASSIGNTGGVGVAPNGQKVRKRIIHMDKLDEIYFNDSGDVRTPSEMDKYIENHPEYKYGYYPKTYAEWYNQLKSSNVNLHTNNPSSYKGPAGLGKTRASQLYDNIREAAVSVMGPTSELEQNWVRDFGSDEDKGNMKNNLKGPASRGSLKYAEKDENGNWVTSKRVSGDDELFGKKSNLEGIYYDNNNNTVGWRAQVDGETKYIQMDLNELGVDRANAINQNYEKYVKYKKNGNEALAQFKLNEILNIVDNYYKEYIKLDKQ